VKDVLIGEERRPSRTLVSLVPRVAAIVHPFRQPVRGLWSGTAEAFVGFRIDQRKFDRSVQLRKRPPEAVVRKKRHGAMDQRREAGRKEGKGGCTAVSRNAPVNADLRTIASGEILQAANIWAPTLLWLNDDGWTVDTV